MTMPPPHPEWLAADQLNGASWLRHERRALSGGVAAGRRPALPNRHGPSFLPPTWDGTAPNITVASLPESPRECGAR